MAPAIMGNRDRPDLGEELKASFCRTDPEIARRFATVTFLAFQRARPRDDIVVVSARVGEGREPPTDRRRARDGRGEITGTDG